MSKSVNDWVKECHAHAKAKGWWDGKERSPLEIFMLCVSELAEATEEVRTGKPAIYQLQTETIGTNNEQFMVIPGEDEWNDSLKPEGELIEIVDCLIRIFDYAGKRGWDLEKALEMKAAYNQKRPYRHGNKLY